MISFISASLDCFSVLFLFGHNGNCLGIANSILSLVFPSTSTNFNNIDKTPELHLPNLSTALWRTRPSTLKFLSKGKISFKNTIKDSGSTALHSKVILVYWIGSNLAG